MARHRKYRVLKAVDLDKLKRRELKVEEPRLTSRSVERVARCPECDNLVRFYVANTLTEMRTECPFCRNTVTFDFARSI